MGEKYSGGGEGGARVSLEKNMCCYTKYMQNMWGFKNVSIPPPPYRKWDSPRGMLLCPSSAPPSPFRVPFTLLFPLTQPICLLIHVE